MILLALDFIILLEYRQEMKKFLLFILTGCICTFTADAAVRDENTISRTKNSSVNSTNNARTTRSVTARKPIKTTINARTSKPISVLIPRTAKNATRTSVRTTSNTVRNVGARAATTNDTSKTVGTRTGAEYGLFLGDHRLPRGACGRDAVAQAEKISALRPVLSVLCTGIFPRPCVQRGYGAET